MAQVLTEKGKEMHASVMSGNSISYYISSGTNPSSLTSAATDVALFSEIGPRILATTGIATTVTTNDTLTITGTVAASGAINISETGISDSVTVPTVGILQPSSTVIGSLNGNTVVTNTALSPGNGGYIQIRTEVMKVTAGSGTTTLTVTRGQASTTPISTIASGDPVAQGNPPGVTLVTGGNLFVKADGFSADLTEGDALTYKWSLVY